MKVKDMLRMLQIERSEMRQRYHELEAHQKTLAIELARVQQDVQKADKGLERLAHAIAVVRDADGDS